MRGCKLKYVIAGAIVLAAVGWLIYSGVNESMVYFYTPTEVRGQQPSVRGKALRVAGMVAPASIHWDPQTLLLTFTLTDGRTSVPVRHRGAAPDLFHEGAGAVVEGTWVHEGYLQASLIMAKHSEEYAAPHQAETLEGKKAIFKSLLGEAKK